MNVPAHVAIIMDGNGRWARNRKLPNIMGHREGVKTVSRVVRSSAQKGIKALTLYAFSTENWKRTKKEVSSLMDLLTENLKKEGEELNKNNIRFNVIGDLEAIPEKLRDEINRVKILTKNNSGMILTLAINYGSREEIINAIKKACLNVRDGKVELNSLREEHIERFLYTSDLPKLDFVIRTSGEKRLSNFLLWQAAYSELYFTDKMWPDFTEEDLNKALEEYDKRERRFGA